MAIFDKNGGCVLLRLLSSHLALFVLTPNQVL
jgi:hypothetical protein